jgi:hypothetical protein
MGLVASKIKSGNAFSIYVLEEEDKDCAFLEFFKNLQQVDQDRLQRYFDYTVNHGLIHNADQFKPLGEKLYEFRTRSGVRALCFCDKGRIMILTNGFFKKKDKIDPQEIATAKLWKAKYEDAKANNTLKFDETDL